MDEYINVGKKILKTLNNNGFEAYFIGESVRNFILKKNIVRVDITTNANLFDVKKIFMEYSVDEIDDSTAVIDYEDYKFYVSLFTLKNKAEKLPNNSKHYSKYLMDHVFNRDFTINAIAMSHSGKIIDIYNGYNDILKKRIKHLGKSKIRFKNNPELMIKAISLISDLNYKLSFKTKNAIKRGRKYIMNCAVETYIDDLKTIFEGPKAKKAIIMMNKTNLDMVLPVFKKVIRLLDSHYKKVDFQEVLLLAFLLNGKIDKQYESYIKDYQHFVKIFNVATQNKKSDYDDITLFNYGLDICLEANKYNHILRRCSNKKKKIIKKWRLLKIKTVDDLLFNKVDIKRIIHPNDYYVIDDILMDAAVAVIAGEIKNTVTDVQSIVISLLNQNGIHYNFNGVFEEENEEEKQLEPKQSDLDIINRHLIQQQKKNSDNIEKTTDELKQNNNQAVDELTSISLDFIKENEKIKSMIKNDKDFEAKLQKFISGYIESEEDKEDE